MATDNPYQAPSAPLEQQRQNETFSGYWDVGTALSAAWNLFKNNFAVVFLSFLIIFAVSAFFSIINEFIQPLTNSPDANNSVQLVASLGSLFISLVSFVVNTWLNLGFLYLLVKLVRGGDSRGEAQISDVFTGGSVLLSGIIANFLSGLLVFVGLLLLIFPGIIISLGLAFTLFLIADRGLGPIEAMKESWRITDGQKGSLFLLFIVCGLITIAGLLMCFIGLLFAAPFAALAMAYVYVQLTGGSQDEGQPVSNQPY